MGRFLFWFIFFIFLQGLLLHYSFDFPHVIAWIGKLPGDMTVMKGKTIYYLPITSAAIFSLIMTFFLSLFSKKEKA